MIRPQVNQYNYISSVCTRYKRWFNYLGYENLDLHFENDGTWHIIQYINSPIIPSMTKWQQVLGPMRNVEVSFSFCEKYTKKLDITKRAFWAREEAKTAQVLEEAARTDRREKEFAERATEAVMRNPGLVDRVVKKGLKEIDLRYLGMNVPKHEIAKPAFKGERIDVPASSEHAVKTIHETVSKPVHGEP